MIRGRPEEILDEYRARIRERKDSLRNVVVERLLPRYDEGSIILSRMAGIFSKVESVCWTEKVDYIDLWDSFSGDRSLYGKYGLH